MRVSDKKFATVTKYSKNIQWGSFLSLLLQLETSQYCIYDYLEIYDGESDAANKLDKLCGSETPDTMESSGPQLFLRFHSDSSGESKGFKLRYAKKAATVSGYSINPLSFTSINQSSVSQSVNQSSYLLGSRLYGMSWTDIRKNQLYPNYINDVHKIYLNLNALTRH